MDKPKTWINYHQ